MNVDDCIGDSIKVRTTKTSEMDRLNQMGYLGRLFTTINSLSVVHNSIEYTILTNAWKMAEVPYVSISLVHKKPLL